MAVISVFWVLFLFNPCSLWSQDPAATNPAFQYLSKVDLPTVTSGDLNYQDLTIALATGPNGYVYTLTFGKGVDKRDSQGNLLQAGLVPASQLDSPRDIAIDEQGYFYIADYLAAGETFTDNGKIRVFDPSGNYLPERTIYSSFYRPLGLDVKGDKIYVAEYYDGLQGPEKGSTFSRIRIYDKNTQAVLRKNENVELPIRIAVNSSGTVYVSQAGSTTPSVLIMDENLNKTGQLPAIQSPGSVVVDAFDYVHVLEYGTRIKFSDFINFETLAFGDLLAISEQMMLGIRDEDFFVKVFNPAGAQVTTLVEQIDFPVDLAFNDCENLYVDNADIFGSTVPFFGYTPSKIEFDLEIYKRIPTFDTAEGPVITCPGNIEVQLTGGETYAVVDFSEASATDACSVNLTQTKGLASGSQFGIGEHLIEYTATDNAGNIATCSFTINVTGTGDLAPQFYDCPTLIETIAQTDQCGAVVTFNIPVASDETGELEVTQLEGLPSGSFFTVGEHPVIFEAIDEQNNRATCEFLIRIKDEEPHGITCPENMEFTVEFGMTGRVVEFDLPEVADNCSGIILEQIEGLPSGSEFPIGITKNTFKVSDEAENSVSCSFEIVITEAADSEPPTITCGGPIFMEVVNGDCGQIVDYALPEVSDNSGEYLLELISGPASGDFFQLGTTLVSYKAVDAEGNSSECSFEVTLIDKSPPVVTSCPEDLLEVISGTEFILEDYRSQVVFSDCSEDLVLSQDPAPGTAVAETTTVRILAEDEAGNISVACVFNVIIEKEELLINSCPSNQVLELDENCEVAIPDFTSQVSTNHSANISQEPVPGALISENTQVTLTAKDANGNLAECRFEISLVDTIFPELTCPGEKQYSFAAETGFELPDYTGGIEATDNCSFEITQEPPPGTVLFESQWVSISVIDSGGNRKDCEFYLNLTMTEEPELEITSCPSEVNLFLNEDCHAVIPDFSDQIVTNLEAQITQSPPAGTTLSGSTSVEIRAEDDAGNFANCSIIVTVRDNTPPEINCGNDIFETIAFGEGFIIPDFQNRVTATDCSENISLVQQPAPGTVIIGSTEITFFAEDGAGNWSQECSFMLILEEEGLEITNCPSEKIVELGANCSFILEDYTAEISTNHIASITQVPPPGTEIFESVVLQFEAQDDNGSVAACSTEIKLNDTTPPAINCPGNLEFTFDRENGFTVPDFRTSAEVSDNCNFEVVQEPAPGNVIFESTEVKLTVSDGWGNSDSCSFYVNLTAEEVPVIEITACPQEKVLILNENCSAQIPDLSSEISTNMVGQIEQNPVAGTVISENTSVEIKATDENGNIAACTINIILEDHEAPEIACRGDLTFSWMLENGFVLPDLSFNVEVAENCNYEIVQEPAPGNVIFENTEVKLTVRDAWGNSDSCSFDVILTAEEVPVIEITACPQEKVLSLDENCSVQIPDLSSEISTNMVGQIEQNPVAGTVISENTSVEITATDENGNVDHCTVNLILEDKDAPMITCKGDLMFSWEPENGFVLPDLSVNVGVVENCGNYELSQQPAPGTVLTTQTTEITFTAKDVAGNVSKCSFLLLLIEETENLSLSCPGEQFGELGAGCAYVIPDYKDLAEVSMEGAVITQNPAPGELITSDTQISLTAQKGDLSASCSFSLSVIDVTPPEVSCVSSMEIVVENNASVSITPEDVEVSSTDNCEIVSKTLSRSTFSSEDIGEHRVTFTVSDGSGNVESCEVLVKVKLAEDPIESLQCVETVSLQLSENRTAILDPRTLFSGGTGTVQYSVSKEEFNCADLGEQIVVFNYTTPNEEGSCPIKVIVEDPAGFCELIGEEPAEPLPYVIITPNPGGGHIKIFTSPEIILSGAEVFDIRGRFLFAKDFSGSASKDYDLDLSMFESGVYTLKLSGKDQEYIRRAIVKND